MFAKFQTDGSSIFRDTNISVAMNDFDGMPELTEGQPPYIETYM